MKTQIIPGDAHHVLASITPSPLPTHLLCATALPQNTFPLSTFYPSPTLSPPSLSISPTTLSHLPPMPSLAKLSEVQGVEGQIATCMYKHRCMSTHTQKHTVLMQAKTTRAMLPLLHTHRVVIVCLSFASLCFAWLPD